MGFLKGSPEKSTSTSGSAQTWAQPFAKQGAQNILSVYEANQPNLNALSGNLAGQLAGLKSQGEGLAQQSAAYGKTAGQGNKLLGQVIGGKYLSGNPHVRNIMGQMGEQILGDVGSAFSSAGRYGSGAYTGTLADSLGDAYARLLYGNYDDEMNRMMQATSLAAQQQQGQQQAQFQNAQQLLAGTQLASQIPYEGINSMGNALGALFNGGTSTSTGKKPGLFDYMAQAASNAAAAAAASSDRRVKTNIVKVDTLEDGLNVYEFEYRNQPGVTFRGVMADEVKELRPHAYIENYRDGYAGVDYGKLAA